MLAILALSLVIPSALGLCENKCQAISSLLSSCSLPPLSTNWEKIEVDYVQRNVTGLPSTYWGGVGPTTWHIANYSQAECFCTDARTEFAACSQCFVDDEFHNDNPTHNDAYVLDSYLRDCSEFGYYANSTLSYPSTTRSSLPFETTAADDSHEEDLDDCQDVCDVIDRQIQDCDLTPLDADSVPRTTNVPSPIIRHYGSVLLNRTAAECMCTLPVLRRLPGCRWCFTGESDTTPMELVYNYEYDCHSFGYWTDSKAIVPEGDAFGSSDDESTPAIPTSGGNPSRPTDNAARQGGLVSMGLVFTSVISAIFLVGARR